MYFVSTAGGARFSLRHVAVVLRGGDDHESARAVGRIRLAHDFDFILAVRAPVGPEK